MNKRETNAGARYRRFADASFSQTIVMLVRRRRVILVGVIALVPVLIPLGASFLLTGRHSVEGGRIFSSMVDMLYVRSLAPLMALFFGAMLIGEEIESQVMPYVLTRPMPRSAWVLGKFAAYLAVSSAILCVSIALTFFASTALPGFPASLPNLALLAHYMGVAIAGLFGYGSVCIFLGAAFKRNIIIGVLLLFGWQRLAIAMPGLLDLVTIEKYVTALLPKLTTVRDQAALQPALAEFHQKQFIASASKAGVTLLLISIAFLILTSWVVRYREFAKSQTIGA